MNDAFNQARDALCEFWRCRRAGLLLPRFIRESQRLISELEACGASVDVVVTYGSESLPLPPPTHTWRVGREGCAGDGLAFYRWLRAPSKSFGQWLAGVDPTSALTFIGDSWIDVPSLLGRSVHGWRRPAWAALEDKTQIDAFWREIGVSPPSFEITACRRELVEPIASRLDRGFGVVIAMDSTQGFTSGAAGLAWVRTPAQLSGVLERFAGRSERLRIAEFMPGLPCSVLAMVMADGVAVFEPLEIITLADPSTGQLRFCGCSNRWRPGAETRELLRSAARRIGESLATKLAYRGMFSVDGILSDGAFYATELNARHASGLGLRAALPDFPLYLFNRAVQESIPGVSGLASSQIERLFCELIRSVPSHSIAVPARVTAKSFEPRETFTTKIKIGDAPQVITYAREGASAVIIEVQPITADGILSAPLSALAQHLTGRPLKCFLAGNADGCDLR
jgi:hypothetical protein